jgi:hypothetical protein
MFEFHGWAVLRWTDAAADNAVQMAAIRRALDSVRSDFSAAEIITTGNDLTVMIVHGLRNHRMASIERLFAVVAKESPESYGLFYVRDDEDARGGEFADSFRVWRIARGEFSETNDPFLSPCVPTIEAPYDPSSDG